MWSAGIEQLILFEDQDILVVKKPAGIDSQRGRGFRADMESLLKSYLAKKGGVSSPYLAVIHRLDRPVSGVMVYAKTKRAAANLSGQLQRGMFSKVYEALVCKKPVPEEGRLEDMLLSDKRTGLAAVALHGEKEAKRASLTYRRISAEESVAGDVLRPFEKALCRDGYGADTAYLRIILETGRHHQIRVQLAHAGFPIAGDGRYGGDVAAGMEKGVIALCAGQLSFRHPAAGKLLTFSWNDDTLNVH